MSQQSRSTTPKRAENGRRHPPRFPSLLFALILILGVLGASSSATAQGSGCSEPGKNVQCNRFGYISMESQRDIRGDPIDLQVHLELDTTFREYDARWIMISVRNVTSDLSNPVMIQYDGFETPHGKVITENVEQPGPHELAIWMHVLDTPVDVPMTLDLTIGAKERGAYRLETLVMAFDRGYEPVVLPSGEEANLFSFTLLGVNEETEALKQVSNAKSRIEQLPAAGLAPALVLLGLLAVAAAGRREAK